MEKITGIIKEILQSWGFNESWTDDLTSAIILVIILAIAFLGDAICKHVILTTVTRLVKKTKATWDDVVFDRKVMIYLSHLVAPIILYILLPLAISNAGLLAFYITYLHDLYHCNLFEVYQCTSHCTLSCIQRA